MSKNPTQTRPKILFATTNDHKIRLFKIAWKAQKLDQKYELVTLNDLPKKDLKIEENSGSFSEDALIKAKIYAKAYNLPTISQDKGFVFDTINWPGTDSKKVFTLDENVEFRNHTKDNHYEKSVAWQNVKDKYFQRSKEILAKIDGMDRSMTVIQGLAVALPGGKFLADEFKTKGRASDEPIASVSGAGGMQDWFFIPDGLNHTISEFPTKAEQDEFVALNLYPITSQIVDFLEENVDSSADFEFEKVNKGFLTQQDIDNLEKKYRDQGFDVAVDCFITNDKGEVFAQKRSMNRRLYPGSWDFPGGHIDAGDSLYTTIFKEVKEEVNWDVDQIVSLVDVAEWQVPQNAVRTWENPNKVILQFEVTVKSLEGLKLQEGKADEYKWINLENFEILKENRQPEDGYYTFDSAKKFLEGKKTLVLVVHGGGSTGQRADDGVQTREIVKNTYSTDKNEPVWSENLDQFLDKKDFEIVNPLFPNASDANYEEWKRFFEQVLGDSKYINYKQIVLIGWSLGTVFLQKYLAENELRKISKLPLNSLHLVGCCPKEGGFEVSENWQSVTAQTVGSSIYIYHSKDDPICDFSDAELYARNLPSAKFQVFQDRGHFEQAEFGELVRNIETTNIKYLIFDFDGVLGDTFEQTISFYQDLNNTSYDSAREITIKNFEKSAYSKNTVLSDVQRQGKIKRRLDFSKHLDKVDFELFHEFIEEIRKLKNTKLAIVSSGSREYILPKIKDLDLDFTHILTFEDHHSKEEKIAQICKDWEVDQKEVYYFTDTKADVLELENFLDRTKIIGCSWGFHGFEKLLELLPKNQILRNFGDIHGGVCELIYP